MLGPRFRVHRAWHSWHTNCKLFLWRWWIMSERWGWAGACWISLFDTAYYDSSQFTTITRGKAVPKVTGIWHHLKFLPTHCDLLPFVCHLLVWPVQYIVDTCSWDEASESQGYHCIFVDPTGSTTTENGVCADALEATQTITNQMLSLWGTPFTMQMIFDDILDVLEQERTQYIGNSKFCGGQSFTVFFFHLLVSFSSQPQTMTGQMLPTCGAAFKCKCVNINCSAPNWACSLQRISCVY